MALITCPECGREKISDQAQSCPDCGYPIAEHFRNLEAQKIKEEQDKHRQEQEKIRQEQEHQRKKNEESTILFRTLSKAFDWLDLRRMTKGISDDLKKNINLDFPVTFVDCNNADEYIDKIKNGTYDYPYVVSHAFLQYQLKYRKYNVINSEEKIYSRYFDIEHFQSLCGPLFDVISDDKEQVERISSAIADVYKEKKEFLVPDLINQNEKNPMGCKIDNINEIKQIYDYDNRKLFKTSVCSTLFVWPQCVSTSVNKINSSIRAALRMIQLAQYCVFVIDESKKLASELGLYESLFKPTQTGIFGSLFEPASTNEYKTLKQMLATGGSCTAELVDASFPNLSMFYHNLPNDIINRTSKEIVETKLKGILASYKLAMDKICDYFKIPEDTGVKYHSYTKHNHIMRSNEGLSYICNALIQTPEREISDIVTSYIEMLENDIEEGMIRREQEDAEWEARYEANGGKSSSFLGAMVGGFVGSKAAHSGRQAESRYRDYKGSAGCLKSRKAIVSCA